MKKDTVQALDFLEYKKTGKVTYISVEETPPEEEENSDPDVILESLAEVMGLSTDELILEIGFILERGQSPRSLGLDLLVSELSSRLVLMESICLYASNLNKL